MRVYYTESKAAPESCHAALCAGCSGALAAQVTVKVIEFLSVSWSMTFKKDVMYSQTALVVLWL